MIVYGGLDVSKDETAICIRDESGHIVWEGKAASNGEALWAALAPYATSVARVVLETGMLAGLLYRALSERNLPVVCVDARRAWSVLRQMPNKTDSNDAAMLAELARSRLYREVHVKGEDAPAMRALLGPRDLLVRQRIWRDAETASRHAVSSLDIAAEIYGRALLGITEGVTALV